MKKRILFINCALFDGETFDPENRHTVTVEGDRITGVFKGEHPVRDDDIIIDVAGGTLMPGLIDAHFHCNSPTLDVAGIDNIYPSHVAQYARRYLEETLLRGFTTVRDAGGADMGLVQAIDDRLIKGPRLFVCGKALSQTGGHGDLRAPGPDELCGCSYKGALAAVVDGEDEVRKAVREELRKGAHQIKLFVSGGVLSPTDPIWMDQFTDAEIRAAVSEAATRRTYVMAHAHTAEAAIRCATSGVRSIEHGTLIDQTAAQVVAENRAFVVPTLTVMEALLTDEFDLPEAASDKLKSISDQAYAAIGHCRNAGAKLGMGTDLFGALHGLETREIVTRARLGGALQALTSATSINAEIIQKKGELGVVRKGALAD